MHIVFATDAFFCTKQTSAAHNYSTGQEQALAVAAKLSSELGLSMNTGNSTSSGGHHHHHNNRGGGHYGGSHRDSHHHGGGHHHGGHHGHDHSAIGPVSMKPMSSFIDHKYEHRIYIPKEEYPYINFVGLILGPKGINQKRMQAETNCRILVKGKGSSSRQTNDPTNEDALHIYISAANQDILQNGINKINQLLHDATNQYHEGI